MKTNQPIFQLKIRNLKTKDVRFLTIEAEHQGSAVIQVCQNDATLCGNPYLEPYYALKIGFASQIVEINQTSAAQTV